MIQTDSSKGQSLKDIRKKEKAEKENKIKELCEQRAIELHGGLEEIKKLSNLNKGLWYLPVMGEDDTIEAMAIMKPISRHILSFASTKINDEGLYAFLEQCMRECWITGDDKILEDDEYFIPAAMQFNKILEGKNATLLKR